MHAMKYDAHVPFYRIASPASPLVSTSAFRPNHRLHFARHVSSIMAQNLRDQGGLAEIARMLQVRARTRARRRSTRLRRRVSTSRRSDQHSLHDDAGGATNGRRRRREGNDTNRDDAHARTRE
jgi:hypothetical protein